jgi:hypothetical protein
MFVAIIKNKIKQAGNEDADEKDYLKHGLVLKGSVLTPPKSFP